MKSDLLCVIPEQLCFGFAEHIFKSVGCCAIILFQGVGVDVHGRGSLCMTQTVGHGKKTNAAMFYFVSCIYAICLLCNWADRRKQSYR